MATGTKQLRVTKLSGATAFEAAPAVYKGFAARAVGAADNRALRCSTFVHTHSGTKYYRVVLLLDFYSEFWQNVVLSVNNIDNANRRDVYQLSSVDLALPKNFTFCNVVSFYLPIANQSLGVMVCQQDTEVSKQVQEWDPAMAKVYDYTQAITVEPQVTTSVDNIDTIAEFVQGYSDYLGVPMGNMEAIDDTGVSLRSYIGLPEVKIPISTSLYETVPGKAADAVTVSTLYSMFLRSNRCLGEVSLFANGLVELAKTRGWAELTNSRIRLGSQIIQTPTIQAPSGYTYLIFVDEVRTT